MKPQPSIEQLDANFRAAKVENGIEWQPATAPLIHGLGWPNESQSYTRLPDRARKTVPEAVWSLSRCSAGLRLQLETDSPSIAVRWSLRNDELALPHMPSIGVSGIDFYARDGDRWRWAGMGKPAQKTGNEAILLETEVSVERQYLIYLPLYNGVSQLEIGISDGFELQAISETRQPICFYGTSIVMGGCASRPGMAYPAILERRLDWPTLNLGFSGNGKAEPEVATLLAELDPLIYVLDPLPNLIAREVTKRIGPFVRSLRAARPHTPIVLVENIVYQNSWLNPKTRQRQQSSNAALQAVYEELIASGVNGLQYNEGEHLLGDDGEATVDSTHPTDLGFIRIADVLTPRLAALMGDLKR